MNGSGPRPRGAPGGNRLRKLRGTVGVLLLAALALAAGVSTPAAHGQETPKPQGTKLGPSGNPVPRFVSLKSSRVNVRKGPSFEHPVAWEFTRVGLPVEVLAEFDHWRRIRDSEGYEGWVFHSLLSGRRTALVMPWAKGERKSVPLYDSASQRADVVAQLEPNVLGSVLNCNGEWCHFSVDSVSGWIQQVALWGVYRGEKIQ